MLWIWLTLAAALSFSLADVFAKRALRRMPALTVGWVKFAGAAALTFPLLASPFFGYGKYPALWPFAGILLIAVPVEIGAIILYHRAIAVSPLSLAVPMMAFSPVFLILAGWLFLGEIPSHAGFAGIFLISSGAYTLHLGRGTGPLTPLFSLVRERGTRLMLAAASLYAVTAALGKLLAELSGPLFFGAFYTLTLTVAVAPLSLWRSNKKSSAYPSPALIFPIAFFYGLMVVLHYAAVVQAPVAYMIAVKRTSLLFAVLWGRLIFKEEALRWRLLGAALILAGVFVLSVFG